MAGLAGEWSPDLAGRLVVAVEHSGGAFLLTAEPTGGDEDRHGSRMVDYIRVSQKSTVGLGP